MRQVVQLLHREDVQPDHDEEYIYNNDKFIGQRVQILQKYKFTRQTWWLTHDKSPTVTRRSSQHKSQKRDGGGKTRIQITDKHVHIQTHTKLNAN